MRPDMFKVIVERPRSGRSFARACKLRPPRDDSTWMPISRGRGDKRLNENLAPLRRFLRKSVGRKWDDVYSEISAGLNVRSAVQKHVRDHLRDLVELHVFERDGELWRGKFAKEKLSRGLRDRLYVCPRTRKLRVLTALPRDQRPARRSPITWLRGDQAA